MEQAPGARGEVRLSLSGCPLRTLQPPGGQHHPADLPHHPDLQPAQTLHQLHPPAHLRQRDQDHNLPQYATHQAGW